MLHILKQELTEFQEDLRKQFIVLTGLPAAGKSTFVNNELSSYFPGAPHFSSVNSDSQVRKYQYMLAKDHFEYLKKNVHSETDLQKFIFNTQYQNRSGGITKLPITMDSLKAISNIHDYWEATYKSYYASYFDIRDAAKREAENIFKDKIHSSGNVVVMDTIGSMPSRTMSRLKSARDENFTTNIYTCRYRRNYAWCEISGVGRYRDVLLERM